MTLSIDWLLTVNLANIGGCESWTDGKQLSLKCKSRDGFYESSA
jgi:hypothetical protein